MRAPPRNVAWLIVTVLFGCSDNPSPVEAPNAASPITRIGMAVVDAASGGSPYFYFLPPTVLKAPTLSGPGDMTLYPEVQICEWSGSGCAGPLVARFQRSLSIPAIWRLSIGAGYGLEWVTSQSNLDPARNYRLRVVLGDFELGYIDLDVVQTNAQAAAVDRSQFLPVVLGSEARAVFYIARDAFFRVTPGARTVSALSGAVTLVVPAKALGDEHHILIQYVALPPADPARLGAPVEILPVSVPISKPLTLSLRYDPTGYSGLDESTLLLKRLVGGVWQNVPSATVNPATKTISAPITMLGTFAVFRSDVATLSGRVTQTSGQPVANASITLGTGQVASTNANGNYSLGGLPPGPTNVSLSGLPGNCVVPLPQTVTLIGGNSATLDFTTNCPSAVANAGPDALIQLNGATTLDGSASQGANLVYTWTPIVWDPTFGTPPTLNGAKPTFTPTSVQRIVYQLQVSDGVSTSIDQLELMVLEDPARAVFVSPFPIGSDLNAGTRAQPMVTIAHAVQRATAMGGDVYISGNPTTFFTNNDLNLATGVSIYGGFDASWTRNAGNPAGWPVLASFHPVRGEGVSNIVLEGVSIQPAGIGGGSVIGLILNNASNITVRYALVASHTPFPPTGQSGNGAPGRTGDPGAAGHDRFIRFLSAGQFWQCDPLNVYYASGVAFAAPGINYAMGGNGGAAGCGIPADGGYHGSLGFPGMAGGSGHLALGGAGGNSVDWSQSERGDLGGYPGMPGQNGRVGARGTDGLHGAAQAFQSGFPYVTSSAGGNGAAGLAGGGGGGGGGSGGSKRTGLGIFYTGGAGGGAGGGGGEGGLGGSGGLAGFSSIAMILVNVTAFSISHSQVTSGNGAVGHNGGIGGIGGAGGSGGLGGTAVFETLVIGDPGGKGGDGGPGGVGGSGGGGVGGASVGILYRSNAPVLGTGVTFTIGSAGLGGFAGGSTTSRGPSGLHGTVVSY